MVPSVLDSGFSALAAARWQEAHDLLVQAVAESPTGVALEALGEACSWLDDLDTIEVRERSYRCYCGEGDARGAARAAIALAFDHLTFRGEAAVGQGWLELAARALADLPLSPEHGHLAVESTGQDHSHGTEETPADQASAEEAPAQQDPAQQDQAPTEEQDTPAEHEHGSHGH